MLGQGLTLNILTHHWRSGQIKRCLEIFCFFGKGLSRIFEIGVLKKLSIIFIENNFLSQSIENIESTFFNTKKLKW